MYTGKATPKTISETLAVSPMPNHSTISGSKPMIGRKRSICIGVSTRSSPSRDRPATSASTVAIGTPMARPMATRCSEAHIALTERAVADEVPCRAQRLGWAGQRVRADQAGGAGQLPQRQQDDHAGEAFERAGDAQPSLGRSGGRGAQRDQREHSSRAGLRRWWRGRRHERDRPLVRCGAGGGHDRWAAATTGL